MGTFTDPDTGDRMSENDADTADTSGQPDTSSTPDTGSEDWKAKFDELQAQLEAASGDAEKWKSLARKHEEQAKANRDAAQAKKTVEEQVADLQRQIAERDALEVDRTVALAGEKLHARLMSKGVTEADASELVETVDLLRFLSDGQIDAKEIDKRANALAKFAGRPSPDPDQGRRSSGAPSDMNEMFRQAARGGRS